MHRNQRLELHLGKYALKHTFSLSYVAEIGEK